MGSIRRSKTKRRTRDLDQVAKDLLSPKHLHAHKISKDPTDLPGLGKHYCVPCAKWFDTEHTLTAHERGKNHKRRIKLLKETPYSHREAEASRGIGIDNGAAGKKTAEEILVLGSGTQPGISKGSKDEAIEEVVMGD